jgi:hypothetical protein
MKTKDLLFNMAFIVSDWIFFLLNNFNRWTIGINNYY